MQKTYAICLTGFVKNVNLIIEKDITMTQKLLTCVCAVLTAMVSFAQDVIVTKDAKKIDAKIIEVFADEIKYKEFDYQEGPTFVLEIADINTVIYSNGKIVIYNQSAENKKDYKPEIQSNLTIDENTIEAQMYPEEKIADKIQNSGNDISLARVERHNGIFVFSDCSPIASYDIIGEVSTTGYMNIEIQNSLAQYQPVRDELIKAAKAANGQVEGVILTLITGGIDKAYLIKFNNPSEDYSLAMVKRYSGVYIFSDCAPLAPYEYLGNLKGKSTLIPQYTRLRDDFIKKCLRKFPNANGIILHLVSGGKDSAEAIKF